MSKTTLLQLIALVLGSVFLYFLDPSAYAVWVQDSLNTLIKSYQMSFYVSPFEQHVGMAYGELQQTHNS